MTRINDIQLPFNVAGADGVRRNGTANRLAVDDRPVHSWYRFVLSFPSHLVRDYVHRFGLTADDTVLDPFCGTGTTLVECMKLGLPSLGIEAHPMAAMAARVKTNWNIEPAELLEQAGIAAAEVESELGNQPWLAEGPAAVDDPRLRRLPSPAAKLLIGGSISPRPRHRALTLLEAVRRRPERYRDHLTLALAAALPTEIGNLHFGPEVGVGAPKDDAPVLSAWLDRVHEMAADLALARSAPHGSADVIRGDARDPAALLSPGSVAAVVTSPPYPNEKDYTRTTRLESVLLGLIADREQLRHVKRGLVRSNTRGVYKTDDDDAFLMGSTEIRDLADRIEARRLELGKTSGFERQYQRVTRLYFGGMARHLARLRPVLRPGAQLAYVVGDQASYLRVMIRTGELLAGLATRLGYELVGIDLFRTRRATATRSELREEVVVLRWPG